LFPLHIGELTFAEPRQTAAYDPMQTILQQAMQSMQYRKSKLRIIDRQVRIGAHADGSH
jgi:hypothetical protein